MCPKSWMILRVGPQSHLKDLCITPFHPMGMRAAVKVSNSFGSSLAKLLLVQRSFRGIGKLCLTRAPAAAAWGC